MENQPMQGYNTGENQVITVGEFTARTFLWMFGGLLMTFGVGFYMAASGIILNLLMEMPYLMYVLFAVELVVVIVLAARVEKMAVRTAQLLFVAYALVNGVTFSTLFYAYDLTSLLWVFAMTAVYFGVMAVYGFVTKADLSSWRTILMSGLIALVAFFLLSMFLPLQFMERVMCVVGVAIFLGFTAYDTQKLKVMHAHYGNQPDMAKKVSIYGALQLYLDFINMFLYLLRLLGNRRD